MQQDIITYIDNCWCLVNGRMVDVNKGKVNNHLYSWYDTNEHWYYPKSIFKKARTPNRWKNSGYDYGFVISAEDERRADLNRRGEFLTKYGWKGYRNGSVPFTGNYKNRVDARVINGLMKEHKDNKYHEEIYGGSFKNLVRAKRKQEIGYLTGWDGLSHHYNHQRGWKRSKKKHQWQ